MNRITLPLKLIWSAIDWIVVFIGNMFSETHTHTHTLDSFIKWNPINRLNEWLETIDEMMRRAHLLHWIGGKRLRLLCLWFKARDQMASAIRSFRWTTTTKIFLHKPTTLSSMVILFLHRSHKTRLRHFHHYITIQVIRWYLITMNKGTHTHTHTHHGHINMTMYKQQRIRKRSILPKLFEGNVWNYVSTIQNTIGKIGNKYFDNLPQLVLTRNEHWIDLMIVLERDSNGTHIEID